MFEEAKFVFIDDAISRCTEADNDIIAAIRAAVEEAANALRKSLRDFVSLIFSVDERLIFIFSLPESMSGNQIAS